jgi:hypothetical protein
MNQASQREDRVAHQSKKFRAAYILLIIAGAGCGKGRPGPAAAPPPEPFPPPTQLYSDNGGGVRDSTRVIVRDASTLATYWQQATSAQPSPPPAPAVDFNRDMVIVVATGRMTAEDAVQVDSLFTRDELTESGRRVETLTVVVRTLQGCGRIKIPAYPVVIVKARRFTGPVKYEESRIRATC